jgi:hypothetical protein
MTDEPATGKAQAKTSQANAAKAPEPVASDSTAPSAEKKLTAAEQMALYEKELKENDWGHQPC